jgi:hypothetical protein
LHTATAVSAQEESCDIIVVHIVPVQRAWRSFSYLAFSRTGMAFCCPPPEHPQQSAATKTQSDFTLQAAVLLPA